MDIIEIDNLRLRCVIGFSEHERKDKQDVVISLRLKTDMRRAGKTDQPEGKQINPKTPSTTAPSPSRSSATSRNPAICWWKS